MTSRSDPRIAALRFSNRVIRSEGGVPQQALVPGTPKEAFGCVVANTIHAGLTNLSVSVGVDEQEVGVNSRTYPVPPRTRAFIEGFDAGEYPELVEQF